jgi:serine/threonine-protein kinase RsbW
MGATTEAVQFVEAAGLGDRAVYLANLVIEEMGTNIIKYGYDDAAVHEILLRLEIQPGILQVVLEDDGHPFNPLDVPDPDVSQQAEDRDPGGLGIHLVRRLVDQMLYDRCNQRNRLTIRIRCGCSSCEPPSSTAQP